MRHLIVSALLSLALGLPTAASAQSVELRLGKDGPQLRVKPNCNPRFENCSGPPVSGRSFRRDERPPVFVGCTDGRALDKAARMGLRRTAVVSSRERSVRVRGRQFDGDLVFVTFSRAPGCPVIG